MRIRSHLDDYMKLLFNLFENGRMSIIRTHSFSLSLTHTHNHTHTHTQDVSRADWSKKTERCWWIIVRCNSSSYSLFLLERVGSCNKAKKRSLWLLCLDIISGELGVCMCLRERDCVCVCVCVVRYDRYICFP